MLAATQGMPVRALPGGAPAQAVATPAAASPAPPVRFFGYAPSFATTAIPPTAGTVLPPPRN